jgi:hypothetical protein
VCSDPFPDVQAFCLFVGYSRSGHSLVGALLDAHPEITVAHEANVLELVIEENLSRRVLFETLLENARRQAEHPRGRHGSGVSGELSLVMAGGIQSVESHPPTATCSRGRTGSNPVRHLESPAKRLLPERPRPVTGSRVRR